MSDSRLVVLIPAHNEEGSIAHAISAVLDQERQADLVVVIPNGCSDRTAEIAREFPVEVLAACSCCRVPEGGREVRMKRKLWIDTRGEPVITTTPNGANNAKRWGWTEAVAVPVEPCGETFSGVPCENGRPGHKLHYANGAIDKARAEAWDEGAHEMFIAFMEKSSSAIPGDLENPYRKAVEPE